MSAYGYLYHHGIKGQQWGVRRFQNPDGTLTPAGRERYYKDRIKTLKNEYFTKTAKEKQSTYGLNKYIEKHYGNSYKEDKEFAETRSTRRKAVAVGAGTAVAVGALLTVSAIDSISTINVVSMQNDYSNATWEERIENILKDDKFSDTIPAGTDIHRVTYGEDPKTLHNESLYTTLSDRDNSLYKNVLGNMQSDSVFSKQHNVTYKTNKDVKAAGGKTLLNEAIKALGYEDVIDADDMKDFAKKTKWNPGSTSDEIKKRVAMREVKEAIREIASKDDSGKVQYTLGKKLREQLIKDGYGAMKDYEDAGYLGDNPTIFLDSVNDLSVDNIKNTGYIDKLLSKWKFVNPKNKSLYKKGEM